MEVTLLIALLCFGGAYSLGTTVDTTSGTMQGKIQFGAVYFWGIPFAEPPVGNLRFRKPVMKSRMSGTYNATFYRPWCPQLGVPGTNEDCLYLNIYAPTSASATNKKSVMVWVHGGSYLFGSGAAHDATLLVLYQDVIVVNINYRLGALGFLNTMDANSDGNHGLWDQRLALQWVKQNIEAFGGNANNITIFGESAGSGCVTQLALSPFTERLFDRVIAESGTAFAPWSNYNDSADVARELGELLGCPTTSNYALVSCLRQRPVEDIVKNQHTIHPGYAFTPTYNTEFLPYRPQELGTTHIDSAAARRFANLDLILGLNIDEGAFFYTGFMSSLPIENPITPNGGISQEVFDYALEQAVAQQVGEDKEVAQKSIPVLKFMYTDWTNINDDIARTKMLTQLLGDSSFIAPITEYARAHLKIKQYWKTSDRGTYMYLFKHRGSWMPKDVWRSGADHGDEIPFVFGHPLSGFIPNVTQAEQKLSSDVMAYWASFAKTGNPNQYVVSPLPTQWPLYETDTEWYIEFDVGMTGESVGQYVLNDRAAFNLDYYPKQLEIFRKESKCRNPWESH